MVYEQWSYRRPILVTENSGSDLSDYAVKIVLNSQNFDSWGKVNPDGSDIRFTDDQGNPLSYWIEKFDSVNQEAIIWVKIPVLQANQQITIYMYYGNPNAISEEDPESVFSFFDDFEDGVIDTNKWNITEGSPSVSNGILTLTATSGIQSINSYTYPISIRHKTKRGYGNYIGWVDQQYQGTIDWHTSSTDNQWVLAIGNGSDWVKKVLGTPDVSNYNIDEFIVLSSGAKMYRNDSYIDELTQNQVITYGYIKVTTWIDPVYVDYIFARPYTDPEPSVTIMSEEYVGVTISVYDSLLVQNAYVSLQRVLETSILVSNSLLVQNASISLSKILEPSILVSDLLAVKNADISISKLLEPTILVSDLIAVQNAEVSLVRTLEPSILVSNALLVQNAYISISRSSEPVILVSDDLLVQNAYVSLLRVIEPSILVSDSLLVENAYIQMLASSEPFITVRDTLLVQNANISLQRLLETIISISGLWAVRNATITLQRTKEVVTKPSGVSAEGIILFASALGILYALAKKKEREEYEVSYY